MRAKIIFTSILFPLVLFVFIINPGKKETRFENKNWKIKIASDDEPGERMIVTGTVYDNDDKPLRGLEIFVYHTDNKGIYGENRQFRLSGTMVTNDLGKYEYNTIKPQSYPSGGFPAHVHYKITGKNIHEQWFELRFEGDKYLSAEETKKEMMNKNFSQIQKLVKGDDGILRCTFDLKIQGIE